MTHTSLYTNNNLVKDNFLLEVTPINKKKHAYIVSLFIYIL